MKLGMLSAWIGTARQRSSRRRVALARGEACRACGTMICGWHSPQGFPKLLLDDYRLTLSFSETHAKKTLQRKRYQKILIQKNMKYKKLSPEEEGSCMCTEEQTDPYT